MSALLFALWLAQAAAPPAPALDLVLMVDVSPSVASGAIKRDRALLTELGASLASAVVPGDTVRIGTTGEPVAVDPTPLRDAAAIRAAADAAIARIGGPSPIWDAVVASVSALETSRGRKAVILVTDGRSTGNRLGFADALEQVQRTRIPVFVVALDRDADANPIPDPGARLVKLAKATGGTCVFVERAALAGGVARAIAALRRNVNVPGETAR